jgi:hypothetical protein
MQQVLPQIETGLASQVSFSEEGKKKEAKKEEEDRLWKPLPH